MFRGSGHPDTKACSDIPSHAGGFYLHYKTVILNNGVVALSDHLQCFGCFYYVTAVLCCSIRPRRSRSAAAYSRQTFRGRSVGKYASTCVSVCVGPSVQCIVEKRRSGSGCRLAS